MALTLEQLGQKIKEKYPQYNNLADKQLALKILVKYPVYQAMVETPTQRQERIGKELEKEKEIGKNASKVGVKEVAKELPRAALQVGAGGPAQFIASAKEVPGTLASGKAEQKTYNLPGLQPFQSLQSEAENMAMAGEPMIKAIGIPALKTVGEGLETLAITKGISKLVPKATEKTKEFFTSLKESSNLKNAIESITNNKLSKKEAIESLVRSGRQGGATEKGTLFKKVETTPDYDDMQAAKAIKDLGIKNSNGPVKNINKISKEVTRVFKEETNPYIELNSKVLSEEDIIGLEKQLDSLQPNLFTKSNDTALKTWENTRKGLKDLIRGTVKDDNSLYETRILYDQAIRKEAGKAAFEPNQKNAALAFIQKARKIINNYIANRMPESEQVLERLSYEHNLLTAIEKIAEKNPRIIGKGVWALFETTHPTFTKVLKYGATAGVSLGGIKALIHK
jgi:hypothetical protein